ncbi:MAG: ParB N-terminal domain-containing protein [Streptosporangiaceae bacterium]
MEEVATAVLVPCSTRGGETCVLPIAALRAGDSPRLEGESLEHAELLASTEAVLPPILVHRGTMRVVDGMHRVHAARLRGDLTVEVRFFDGEDDEAFVAAVRANMAHGLPLTRADREAAAARIIGWRPERSDRWIAEVTGLAPGTVAAIRGRVVGDGDEVTARIGRDGRVRPLSSAQGRLMAQQEIARNPEASLREIAKAAGVSPATARDVRARLERGADPVPPGQRAAGDRRASAAPEARNGRRASAPLRGAGADINSSLQELSKDPSLRYSQAGRMLLQSLSLHARGPEAVQNLLLEVPPHCQYLVAELARRYAGKWQALAEQLESELRSASRARLYDIPIDLALTAVRTWVWLPDR